MRNFSETDVVLVLTGCVIPNCDCTLKVTDINIRRKHYCDSIRWYLVNTPYKIVFCENSGTDISGDFIEYCDRTEFLTYVSSNSEGQDRSKGYKEMEILQYAYKNSLFIQNGGVFVKITGRLIMKNIVSVVNYLLRRNKKAFISSYQNARRPMSDCRFIFFTKEVWSILFFQKEKIFHWNNFERITYDVIEECLTKGITFIYPPYLCNVKGISGGSGHSYELTNVQYVIQNMKHIIRWILFRINILPYISKNK